MVAELVYAVFVHFLRQSLSLCLALSLSPSLTLKYKITSHARIFLQRDVITITTTSPGASVRERERETWIMILIPVKSLHRIADEWQCHGYIVGWRRRGGQVVNVPQIDLTNIIRVTFTHYFYSRVKERLRCKLASVFVPTVTRCRATPLVVE